MNIRLALNGASTVHSVDDHNGSFGARAAGRNIRRNGAPFGTDDECGYARSEIRGRVIEEDKVPPDHRTWQQVRSRRRKHARLDGAVRGERDWPGVKERASCRRS